MKTFNRFLLGLVSSLLLTCGLARAAEHCDPTAPLRATGQVHSKTVAPNTVLLCALK